MPLLLSNPTFCALNNILDTPSILLKPYLRSRRTQRSLRYSQNSSSLEKPRNLLLRNPSSLTTPQSGMFFPFLRFIDLFRSGYAVALALPSQEFVWWLLSLALQEIITINPAHTHPRTPSRLYIVPPSDSQNVRPYFSFSHVKTHYTFH